MRRTPLPREAELARLRRTRGVMAGLALAYLVAAAVPSWLLAAMREDGMPLVDAPLVLTRDILHGLVPEPDGVGVVMAVLFGGTTGLTFGATALGFHRAYRHLLARGPGA